MATIVSSPVSQDERLLRKFFADEFASETTFDRLVERAEPKALANKETLRVDEGQDFMVLIAKGAAKLEVTVKPCSCNCDHKRGRHVFPRQILSFHFPGDFVPVLSRTDTHASLAALTPVHCFVFPTNALLGIARDEPGMLRTVLGKAFQAVDAGRYGMIQLASASASERLVDFLRAMALRIGGAASGPCEFVLPMSRREIADHLGLTIETVSRQFAALREAGVIETRGRSTVRLLTS